MRANLEIPPSVPAFLGKLWKLVNDPETNHLISWSPGGKAFRITNQADFAREHLPLYYKHNNMASFIRQLNMYGFHKITSVEMGGLRYERDEIEFSHPCFVKGHPYLLDHIKRKIANTKTIVTSTEDGENVIIKPEVMNKVLTDVKQMKGKQETLDAKFSAMKQENEALWREVAILRQKHVKQQQIVNNLIQFLMSLVQPTRAGNSTSGTVTKRPYQLMINNAAHNTASEETFASPPKHFKRSKDSSSLRNVIEDNLEEGPTIHELAHDDILPSGSPGDDLEASNYVTVELQSNKSTAQSPADTLGAIYEVTIDDTEDLEPGVAQYTVVPQTSIEQVPIVTSPSPTPVAQVLVDNLTVPPTITLLPSTSKSPGKKLKRTATKKVEKQQPSANFNIAPTTTEMRPPAEIFASDDPINEESMPTITNDYLENVLQESLMSGVGTVPTDKMVGGVNIKVENNLREATKGTHSKKAKSKGKKDLEAENVRLQNIKTELQDDLDWDNMTLATLNNTTNRLETREDIDDHLDTMQTDLDSLREFLRNDSYALDANTLMGLFNNEDPFYGLSFNPPDDKSKGAGENDNQLISYTGALPDFVDIGLSDLDGENSQEACMSPSALESSTLNTPQMVLKSPSFPKKP